MRVVLVVPCYNEADRLDVAAFTDFLSTQPDFELCFVDDGSADGTSEVIAPLCRERPARVRAVRLERNSGKAEAVRTGMVKELDGGADVVGFWDADLATPLEDAVRFAGVLDAHPSAEVIIGSRIRMLGHPVARAPLRHYLGRGFATAASLVLRLATYDTQCGAKLFRNTNVNRAAFAERFRTNWIFDVELLARVAALHHDNGHSEAERFILEHPVSRWTDVAGSKLKATSFLEAARDLAVIERTYGGRLGGRFGRIRELFMGDEAKR